MAAPDPAADNFLRKGKLSRHHFLRLRFFAEEF
jgi:hypothetical protein